MLSTSRNYLLLAISLLIGCSFGPPPKWELAYQTDIDKKRIKDVHNICRIIEKFHGKAGYYPLTEGRYKLPVEVMITNRDIGYSNPTIPMDTFREVIRDVLGEEVHIPIDPQKADAWGGPRLYHYFSDGETYSVFTHLFFPTEYTKPIYDYTHRYQISSVGEPGSEVFSLDGIEHKNGGSRIDLSLQMPLLIAVDAGDIEEVSRLIVEGALLNPICRPHVRCKPLATAAQNGDLEMIELLISNGADPDGISAYDDTPLIYALIEGNHDAVRLLIGAGADVNKPNSFGMTPFIGVCAEGSMDLVNLFIENGADLNSCYAIDLSGEDLPFSKTPLIAASENGNLEVVDLLLRKGADPESADSGGNSPLDYARENSHIQVERIISNYINRGKHGKAKSSDAKEPVTD